MSEPSVCSPVSMTAGTQERTGTVLFLSDYKTHPTRPMSPPLGLQLAHLQAICLTLQTVLSAMEMMESILRFTQALNPALLTEAEYFMTSRQ